MTEGNWIKTIKGHCEAAGTYRPFFDSVIQSLAAILARRDDAVKQYKQSGGNPVIGYTNKAKQTNLVINPALAVIEKLDTVALAYWRDLGLTPAGLKRIDEESMRPKKRSVLADVLKELDEGL